METISKNLAKLMKQIMENFVEYMTKYSSIEQQNGESEEFIVINVHGNNRYQELSPEGRKLQSALLKSYRRFHSILDSLLTGQSTEIIAKFSELHKIVMRTIEHDNTWASSTRDALNQAIASLQDQLRLFTTIYEPITGVPIYVPDTNALIHNPLLETWQFSQAPNFKILLLPTVLSELDKLKINHRNEDVREKAEKIIRQIKEYRRRGSLSDGVPVLKDKIFVMSMAVEPKMDKTLYWLDPNSMDDRFLGSVLEVMKNEPQTAIVIVTRDINMQNKAEYAEIPFIEPPTPPAQ